MVYHFFVFFDFTNTYQKETRMYIEDYQLAHQIRTAICDDGSLYKYTSYSHASIYPIDVPKIPLKPMLLGSLHQLKGTKLVSFACKSHLLLYKYTRSQHTRMQLMHDTSELVLKNRIYKRAVKTVLAPECEVKIHTELELFTCCCGFYLLPSNSDQHN